MSAIINTNPYAAERCPRCGADTANIAVSSVNLEKIDPTIFSQFKHYVDLHVCTKCKFAWAENEACYTTSQVAQFLMSSIIAQIKEELSNQVQTRTWFDSITRLLITEQVLPSTYTFDSAKSYPENYLDLIIKVSDFIASASKEDLLNFCQSWVLYMEEPIDSVPDIDSLSDPVTFEEVLIEEVLIDD